MVHKNMQKMSKKVTPRRNEPSLTIYDRIAVRPETHQKLKILCKEYLRMTVVNCLDYIVDETLRMLEKELESE